MAKTYELLHNGQYVPATFIKDSADVDLIWLEYDHVEDDEDGNPLPAVKREIHIRKDDAALKITETPDE